MKRSHSGPAPDAPSYATLFDSIAQAVLIVQGGAVALANPAAAKLFAAPAPEALAGRPLGDLLAPELAKRVLAAEPADARGSAHTLGGEARSVSLRSACIVWNGQPAQQVALQDETELEHLRGALAEQESQFRHLIDGSLQGIYVHSEHRFLFVNQTFATLLGYDSPEDVLAVRDVFALYAPSERDRLRSYYQARVSGGRPPVRYEFQGLRRDGSTVWLENLVRVVTWHGRGAVLATVLDISERKRFEHSLLASEEKYRNVVESALQGIVVHRNSRALFANQAMAELFGYASPEELYALSDLRLIISEEERERMDGYARARLRGESAPDRYVFRAAHKDGRELWVDTSVRLVNWDGEPAVQGAVVDVTERVRAERELRASEEKYRFVLENSLQGVVVERSRRALFANQAMADLFGFESTDEILALPSLEALVAPDMREDILRRARSRMRGEPQPKSYVMHALRKDGSELWTEVSSMAVTWDGVRALQVTLVDVTERVLAERELAVHRRLLEAVFDTMPHALYVKNTDLTYRMVNRAFGAMVQTPPEHIIGKRIADLGEGYARIAERIEAADRAAMASGRPQEIADLAVRKLDGSLSRQHMIRYPLFDEHGRVTGIVGITEDITERKAAEEAVRDNERLLRTVIDTLPHSIYVRDRDRRYRVVNRAMAEYQGLPMRAMLGHTMRDFKRTWTPQLEMLEQADTKVLQEGGALDLPQVKLTHANGRVSIRRVLKRPLVDDSGRIMGVVGIAEDITERLRSEEELRASRHLLQTVFNLLPLWVFVKNRERRFLMVNRKMAEDYALATDVEPGAMIDLGTSITAEERNVIYQLDQRVLETGELVEVPEVQITLPRGETRLFRTLRMPLRDAGGAVTGIVGIAEDITERKRTEQAIQQAQKLESLGVLAGGVAHDFNNLLVSILGNASLALLDLPADSPAQHPLAQIETAGQRAAELCRQMLAYSGKGSFEIASLNLNGLIEEMTQLLHVSLARSIQLTYAFDAELPAVEVDPTQIRQVVMNLVMNAAEAIGERPGTITVATAVVQATREQLRGYIQGEQLPEGRYVMLEVTDTGEGMPPQMLGRIFDPFFTTKFAGRGLGLAAVLGIVRGHRGALQVRSEPAQGSTFRMLLPAQAGTAGEASRAPLVADWRGEGTVLLVDDEPDVRMVVERMIQSLGFGVIAVTGGEEALAALAGQGDVVRLVAMDVHLTGQAGTETLEALRAERPDLPVVLLSAYAERDLQQRFAGLGVGAFLQKPFTRHTLAAKLRALLD